MQKIEDRLRAEEDAAVAAVESNPDDVTDRQLKILVTGFMRLTDPSRDFHPPLQSHHAATQNLSAEEIRLDKYAINLLKIKDERFEDFSKYEKLYVFLAEGIAMIPRIGDQSDLHTAMRQFLISRHHDMRSYTAQYEREIFMQRGGDEGLEYRRQIREHRLKIFAAVMDTLLTEVSLEGLSDEEKDCAICGEKLGATHDVDGVGQVEQAVRLRNCVQHHYGNLCISTWFKNSRTCPICRTSYHQFFNEAMEDCDRHAPLSPVPRDNSGLVAISHFARNDEKLYEVAVNVPHSNRTTRYRSQVKLIIAQLGDRGDAEFDRILSMFDEFR